MLKGKDYELTDEDCNTTGIDNLYDDIKNNGYDPAKMCICIDEKNNVLDGQHRSCCILMAYGKNKKIKVCRVMKSKKLAKEQENA